MRSGPQHRAARGAGDPGRARQEASATFGEPYTFDDGVRVVVEEPTPYADAEALDLDESTTDLEHLLVRYEVANETSEVLDTTVVVTGVSGGQESGAAAGAGTPITGPVPAGETAEGWVVLYAEGADELVVRIDLGDGRPVLSVSR